MYEIHKTCEYDAIKMRNFRAIIDPDKCTSCGACVDVLSKKIVLPYILLNRAKCKHKNIQILN